MTNQIWREFNPNNKTVDWMRRILVDIQVKKQFLITQNKYELNQSFADGRYDVAFARKKYDVMNTNPNNLDISFEQIDLMGNRINAIVSMLEKMGFNPIANTTDPTASSKKDQDIELLKAEKELEPIRKKFADAIGLKKPLPIADQEDFSSDITPIKKLGLDISNPIDEAIFRDYLQRQVWEIALEVGMNHYMNQNEYNEKFKLLTADLINQNCCAAQVITNSFSGEAEISYLYPFNVYTILAKQNDGKDAIAKGWEKNVPVRSVIALMGKDVTADELDKLLSLANSSSGTNYTGIWFSPDRIVSNDQMENGYSYPFGTPYENCCSWGVFLNLTIGLGYIEVKSQNSDLYIHRKENGNLITVKEMQDYVPPKNIRKVKSAEDIEKDSDRFLEYKFYDVTYKAYYIPYSNYVFGFGKLPLAVRYGTTNELTDFSICTQKMKGKSMNEKCQPFIKHIFDLWCKLQYFINESRASGEAWNWSTIRELSALLIGTDANQGKFIETLKMLTGMTNTMYLPEKIDGVSTGGDSMPVKWMQRGIDPTVFQMWDLIQQDKNQIIEITGVSDVLLATSSSKSGLGVSQIALEQSLNTIYYIQSAIQKLFGDVCVNISQKIQLVVKGDKSAEAYKAITMAIGERNVEAIRLLGTRPPSSVSIFIEWGLTQIQRQQVDQLTEILVQSKLLTAAQAFQIKNVKSWKLAGALLSYYEAKNAQQQQQGQMMSIQVAAQTEEMNHQYEMEEILAKNKGITDVATINAQAAIEQEKIKAANKESVTSQREISRHLGEHTKHENEMERMSVESSVSFKEDSSV